MTRLRWTRIVLAMSIGLALPPLRASAQEPRLAGRLPEPARRQVDDLLTAARAEGLPTEPLVTRALEGGAKGAPADLIVAAVTRLREELRIARTAFGEPASSAELTAGASALRAGATGDDLTRLRRLRPPPDYSLTIAAAVLADLVSTGVPADTAISAVLALASRAADADYITFRRNVQRDIALGASPSAALAVRLQDMTGMADGPQSPGTVRGPRKRP